MDGRAFLTVAREVVRGATEAHWRTAAGRAYYALVIELRDAMTRWGLSRPIPSHVHQIVRRRVYASSDADMKQIGRWLDRLRDSRNEADYEMGALVEFATDSGTNGSISRASGALKLLDLILADIPRRDSIAAEIQAVLP